MAEKEKPEHIEKFDRLSEMAEKAAATTDLMHLEAYVTAAKETLTDDDDQVDHKRLNDIEVQDKFVDKMAELYLEKTKDHFKISKDDDIHELYEENLIQAYTGITKGTLKNQVRAVGEKFTSDYFVERVKNPLIEQIRSNLRSSAASHLKDEHIDDLISHSGLKDYIDAKNIRVGEAATLYRNISQNKGINKEILRLAPEVALTDKAKKEYGVGTTGAYKKVA